MGEINNLKESLSNELINGANLQKMLDISEQILNTPLALNDLTKNIFLNSANFPPEEIEDRLNVRKSTPIKERSVMTKQVQTTIKDGIPRMVNWPYMRNNQIVCGGLVNNNYLAGYITIPCKDKSLEDFDSELIKFIAKTMSTGLVLNRTNCFKDYLTSDHNLLLGILTGKYCTENRNPEYYWNAFDNISSYRILWYIPIDKLGNILSNKIIDTISTTIEHCWQVPFNDGYAIMIDGDDSKILKELDNISKKEGFLIGSSDTFNNLMETIDNYNLSQNVLYYAQRSSITSGIAYFDEYKLLHILTFAKKHMNLDKLQSKLHKDIIKYDKDNNTEYDLTLSTYLYSNLNLKDSASKLCVHKNTVSYRISKIKEIFNIDLDNIQTITSIYCSLLIMDETETRS